MSKLEIAAVIASILTVWFTTTRNMWCWPIGLVSVALYGKVFLDAKFYSDMLLQGFFAVSQIYGWILWHRDRQAGDGAITLATPTHTDLALGALGGTLGTLGLGTLMASLTDAAVPWLDAALTSISLVATYWTARRFIANWWLWIGVDVVYTGLFVWKGLNLTAALYAAFVGLAVLGLRRWRGVEGAVLV